MEEVMRQIDEILAGPRLTGEDIDVAMEVTSKFMALDPSEKQDVFLYLLGARHLDRLS